MTHEAAECIEFSYQDVYVVIAAFNEAPVIGEVVDQVLAKGVIAVVVDDGSTDGSAEISRSRGAEVVRHPMNLGQGAALQTGISYALLRGASIVVTMDADGQHNAEDAVTLAQVVISGEADVAMGSRFLGADAIGISFPRRLVLRAAALFTRIVLRVRVTDAHNGLRAMSRRAAESIMLTQNGMAHATEFLARIRSANLSYVEVPVVITYTDYSRAKGQRISGSVSILWDLLVGRMPS